MSKFKVYCRIIDYIQARADEKGGEMYDTLAKIIRGTCADMALNSTRGRPGVTFLMPSDAAYINKIADLAYSSEIDEAEKAADMLHSLILSNVYYSAAEIKSDKYLANCVMPPQALEVKKIDGDKVYFTDSTYAVIDKRFQNAKRKFAVWTLYGEMPVRTTNAIRRPFMTGEEKDKMKTQRKTGKYEMSQNEYSEPRMRIVIAIENIYLLNRQQQCAMGKADKHDCDVYFHYSMSLLSHICAHDNDLFSRIMWKISGDKSDLYFLIEPYTPESQCIVPTKLIEEWWANNSDYARADMKEAKRCIDAWMKSSKSSRMQARDTADRVRGEIGANGVGMAREIGAAYASNAVGPSEDRSAKLVEDEVRFLCAQLFCRFEASPRCDPAQFNFITNFIGDYLHRGKPSLTDEAAIRLSIQPIEKLIQVRRFLHSSWFMYVPLCKDEMSGNTAFRPKGDREMSGFWVDIKNKMSEHVARASNANVNERYILDAIQNNEEFRSKVQKELSKFV